MKKKMSAEAWTWQELTWSKMNHLALQNFTWKLYKNGNCHPYQKLEHHHNTPQFNEYLALVNYCACEETLLLAWDKKCDMESTTRENWPFYFTHKIPYNLYQMLHVFLFEKLWEESNHNFEIT
jgi:hypothetical protein